MDKVIQRALNAKPYFIVFLITAFWFFTENHHELISNYQAFLGLSIIALGALPSFIHLINAEESRLIPLVPLHGLFYSIAYGIPIFVEKTNWFNSSTEAINHSLVLTIVGLVMLYIGYYGARHLLPAFRPIRFSSYSSCGDRHLFFLCVALFVISMLFEFSPLLRSIPSLNQIAVPTGFLSIGILFVLHITNRLQSWERTIFFCTTVLLLLVKLVSGLLALPVFVLMFFSILYWQMRKKILWLPILLLCSLAIILQPVKDQFRALTWYSESVDIGHYEKLKIFTEVGVEYYLEKSQSDEGANIEFDSLADRLAHIATFSVVVADTPQSVPYWNGETYKNLLTKFIPRFLWQDKPREEYGLNFGHRYGFLNWDDEITSVNMPWLPEFYANFGWKGVVFGMFFVGVLFRYFMMIYNNHDSVVDMVAGLAICFRLGLPESNLSMMLGGIVTYTAFLFVLLRMLTIKRRDQVVLYER
jgi:hypothetical protein